MTQLQLPAVPEGSKHDYWPHITVVTVYRNIVRGTVNGTAPLHAARKLASTFRWNTQWAYSERARFNEEGVTWIQGWHDSDSEAARALLAIRGLA